MLRAGSAFIFAVGRVTADTNELAANYRYARGHCVAQAKTQWIKMVHQGGTYVPIEPSGDLGEPLWPAADFATLLHRAARDIQIESHDHPALKEIRGCR